MSPDTNPVRGCPVADGEAPCSRGCGGGWPGTKVSTEALTRAVKNRKIDPAKLGCQPLQDRVTDALNN